LIRIKRIDSQIFSLFPNDKPGNLADLSSEFAHVPIAPRSQNFLRVFQEISTNHRLTQASLIALAVPVRPVPAIAP
jgi:hypothetical protein